MFPSISDSCVEAIFIHRLVAMTVSSPVNQMEVVPHRETFFCPSIRWYMLEVVFLFLLGQLELVKLISDFNQISKNAMVLQSFITVVDIVSINTVWHALL